MDEKSGVKGSHDRKAQNTSTVISPSLSLSLDTSASNLESIILHPSFLIFFILWMKKGNSEK